METAISIIIALIIFGLLVLIHEFGHFIVAKKNGVFINEFSVGMGPRILSKVAKSGTRYSLKILPLGGSCAMLGEDEDNEEEGSFNSKSIWARMAIVFAGPFFNFILALLLAFIVIGAKGADVSYVTNVDKASPAYEAGLRQGDRIVKYNGAHATLGREIYLEDYVNPLNGDDITVSFVRNGETKTIKYSPEIEKRYIVGMQYAPSDAEAEITQVTRGSAFFKAGVQAGDVVTEIDGTAIKTGNDMNDYLTEHPFGENEVKITLDRKGKTVNVTVKPIMTKIASSGFDYNIGREKQSIGGVIKYSFTDVRYEIATVLKSLKMLVTGKVSANEISGPVGIVNVIGNTYSTAKSQGTTVTILSLINLAIMLSANLGVMNLLPLPALDGGRLFLYIIEVITRKKIPKDKEGMIHFIGFILLMALMVFLLFNDIRKLI